jgi:cephalosporin-C deacetylase-like acetyl esterase
VAGALGLLAALSTFAQDSPLQRYEMATNHLKRIAAEMSARCLSDIRTLDDWKQKRVELRGQLLEMLGLSPLPGRTPLKPRITGVLERETHRVEKLVFQSLPGLYVTGNFYVPKSSARPLPTILYLCGHAPHPLGAKFNYQDRAAWFAAHGFACLILDTLEFGEVPGIHHGTHDLNLWHWLSLGYTPAGTEVWNALRALDYLETRPEVDSRRIGVTGISGGGAITWYTAAVDERVQAAAPICSTFTFGSQAANWRASGQCDCIYFHNTYGWEFPTVAALIAPRPLLIVSGRKDLDFPPDGYHEVFERSRKIYDLHAAGGSDRIREVDDDVGHSDPPQFLREARQWMRRWLQNESAPLGLETNAQPRETAEDLACLNELPADAINFRVQNRLTSPVSLKKPRSRTGWDQRRAELLAQLNEKVFRWFPREKIPFETRVSRNGGGWAPRYADYKDVSFQTEKGVRVRAQLLTPKPGPAGAPLLLYVKRPGDSIYFMDLDELLPVLGRYTVLILNPRFSELPVSPAENASIQMTAAWTGRTIAAMQAWDILRAVEWAVAEEKLPESAISVYGKGDMGILALYSALFDGRIQQVILSDPPASHWQGPALLNVLRITDIPEAAGALAPRRLVSLTKLPEAFDYSRDAYQAQRASAQFVQSGSLPEALEVWKHPGTTSRTTMR